MCTMRYLLSYSRRFRNKNYTNSIRFFGISVGGIYTVIRSKAYISTEEMGDQFCLIGPYKEHCARTEVEECSFTSPALCDAVEALRHKGFKVNYIKF